MPSVDTTAFSQRLRTALKRGAKGASTATELANQFNLRHHNEPITAQAAQKWLSGRAVPTSDKIETLADWLNVSSHWLHYGPAPQPRQRQNASTKRQTKSQTNTNAGLSEKESKLIGKIRLLSEHQFFLSPNLSISWRLNVRCGPKRVRTKPPAFNFDRYSWYKNLVITQGDHHDSTPSGCAKSSGRSGNSCYPRPR